MASIARSTANRAVHLRITPRPSRLGESREILRLIEQFGPVEYYKNLKYDFLASPNTALVIFKSEEAANQCMKKSPIRFRMGKAGPEAHGSGGSNENEYTAERPTPSTQRDESRPPIQPTPVSSTVRPSTPAVRGAYGLSSVAGAQSRSMSTASSSPSAVADSLPEPPSRPPQMPFQSPPPQLLDSRIYQVQVHPARINFRDQINNGYYHGRFAIDSSHIPQKELVQTVPLAGLSCVDWQKGDRPWRVMLREKERERSGHSRRRSLREAFAEGIQLRKDFRDSALPR